MPLRYEATDKSEMVSQVLYGELFKVLEQRKKWSRIRLAYDNYEGWIDNKQYLEITEAEYKSLNGLEGEFATDLVEFVHCKTNHLYPIPMGASLNTLPFLEHTFDGAFQ